MKKKGGASKGDGVPVHPVLSSSGEYRRSFLLSFWLHTFLVSILTMFLPMVFVGWIAAAGFGFWIWSVFASNRAFDHLASNYLLRLFFFGWAMAYSLLGYMGSSYLALNGDHTWLAFAWGLGFLSIAVTIAFGFREGVRAQEKHSKKSLKSIEWETGIYDVRSNSLDAVDVNAAIVESVPTWKLLMTLLIFLSPGPIIGVTAGKISDSARYILAVPAFWAMSMFWTYFLLRMAIDYRIIRNVEYSKKIRIILSTSALAVFRPPK